MRNYHRYLPAIVFLIGAGFVLNTRSQAAIPLAAPLAGIMSQVDGYRVEDQHLSDDERRVAGMTDYVARMYSRDSVAAFTTFVSYYERQTQGKTIHSPRNCLPGAGWEVLTAGEADVVVDGVKQTLNRYVLKKGPATAVAFYWYQGRGRLVANEYTVKWNLLRDAALAGHTEEALVRVVVPVAASTDGNEADALRAATALGEKISARLAHEVSSALPKA
jgi:EpsI family protein